MTDRNAVASYIAEILHDNEDLPTCRISTDALQDALALILEQETTFIKEEDRTNHYHCEKCGYVTGIIARMHKYCPECGRRVTQ